MGSLTTHWNGRAVGRPLMLELRGVGGSCAPFNSSVRRYLCEEMKTMKLILKLVICLYALTIAVSAQTQEQTNSQSPIIGDVFRFDMYSNLSLKDERIRLDNIARTFAVMSEGIIYFVAYGGDYSCKGEAQARATFSKNYLMEKHGIPFEHIMWKDGGYMKESTIEVWLLPKGGLAPDPSMEAYPIPVQIRNCRSKYLRQVKRVNRKPRLTTH